MPKGTRVHATFEALKREGMSVESAARIAQNRTGQSLQTGRKPKRKKRKARRINA